MDELKSNLLQIQLKNPPPKLDVLDLLYTKQISIDMTEPNVEHCPELSNPMLPYATSITLKTTSSSSVIELKNVIDPDLLDHDEVEKHEFQLSQSISNLFEESPPLYLPSSSSIKPHPLLFSSNDFDDFDSIDRNDMHTEFMNDDDDVCLLENDMIEEENNEFCVLPPPTAPMSQSSTAQVDTIYYQFYNVFIFFIMKIILSSIYLWSVI